MMLTCAGKTLWGVCQGGNRLGKQAEILADLRKWSRKTGRCQKLPISSLDSQVCRFHVVSVRELYFGSS